jgi:hypothetical protein
MGVMMSAGSEQIGGPASPIRVCGYGAELGIPPTMESVAVESSGGVAPMSSLVWSLGKERVAESLE